MFNALHRKKSSDRGARATKNDVIPKTWAVCTTVSRSDPRERLPDLRHFAVTKFHKDQAELTGYTLDRWDLHGVPFACAECTAEYETLRMMQLDQDRQLLRRPS